MFGRGGRGGGGGGGRQVCHFFLEGRCRFGGMVMPNHFISWFSYQQVLTQQQTTARTSILQDKAVHNLRVALVTTDSLHSTITTTKAAQGIDQALLAQVRSLLPSPLLLSFVALRRSRTPLVQLDSTPSLQQLHFNTSAHDYQHHALPCDLLVVLRYPPQALLFFDSNYSRTRNRDNEPLATKHELY